MADLDQLDQLLYDSDSEDNVFKVKLLKFLKDNRMSIAIFIFGFLLGLLVK